MSTLLPGNPNRVSLVLSSDGAAVYQSDATPIFRTGGATNGFKLTYDDIGPLLYGEILANAPLGLTVTGVEASLVPSS